MLYRYFVEQSRLSDDQIESLLGLREVVSEYSPRAIRTLCCFDCEFPNGDVYPLTEDDIDIASCSAA